MVNSVHKDLDARQKSSPSQELPRTSHQGTVEISDKTLAVLLCKPIDRCECCIELNSYLNTKWQLFGSAPDTRCTFHDNVVN